MASIVGLWHQNLEAQVNPGTNLNSELKTVRYKCINHLHSSYVCGVHVVLIGRDAETRNIFASHML